MSNYIGKTHKHVCIIDQLSITLSWVTQGLDLVEPQVIHITIAIHHAHAQLAIIWSKFHGKEIMHMIEELWAQYNRIGIVSRVPSPKRERVLKGLILKLK